MKSYHSVTYIDSFFAVEEAFWNILGSVKDLGLNVGP